MSGRVVKKFFWRGHSLEELKAMPLDRFVALLPCKQRRTMQRAGLQVRKFLEHFRKKAARGAAMRTTFRSMPILPEMIGSRIKVHIGNAFVDVVVRPEMLGHRLGEFAHTTKLVRHSGPGVGATRGSKAVELK